MHVQFYLFHYNSILVRSSFLLFSSSSSLCRFYSPHALISPKQFSLRNFNLPRSILITSWRIGSTLTILKKNKFWRPKPHTMLISFWCYSLLMLSFTTTCLTLNHPPPLSLHCPHYFSCEWRFWLLDILLSNVSISIVSCTLSSSINACWINILYANIPYSRTSLITCQDYHVKVPYIFKKLLFSWKFNWERIKITDYSWCLLRCI